MMHDIRSDQQEPEKQLQQLVSQLSSHNGMTRRHARVVLERAGSIATGYLTEALSNRNTNVRWEAAKALKRIADPKAGAALVRALTDNSFEIQWLAAEALVVLGRDALRPLLEGLVHSYGSIMMRQGAHHVLYYLERQRLLPPATQRVLDELRCLEPLEPYPVSARRALRELSQMEIGMPAATDS